MHKNNPHGIKEGDTVAFLTNLTICYAVTRVWSTGKVDLVPAPDNGVSVPFSAHARELVPTHK